MTNSIYIHIPFCTNICTYCDFSKFFYNKEWVSNYLDSLKKEILDNYKGEVIKTIYIGGGTPSCLSIDELNKLFDIIKIFNKDIEEFTFECNIDITEDKIKLLKANGVNRISIGVQTINEHLLKVLGRHHTKEDVYNKINMIKKYIDNINIDLMYALPLETMEDLNNDLDFITSLNIKHVSAYSLIIEPNTKLYIDNVSNIDEDLDYQMYIYIKNYLKNKGFNNYEISNYCIKGYESKHNLVYWNNLNYYGFGIGASGYIDNIRYDNTKSYKEYTNGKYRYDEHTLNFEEILENEFILGLRKIDGIDIDLFDKKYHMNILSIPTVKKLLNENKLIVSNNRVKINEEYIYTSNRILVEFLRGGS